MKQRDLPRTYEDLRTLALDRILTRHARHCTYWIFSGDRHCSCGRDGAILELEKIRSALRAVSDFHRDEMP